MKRIILSVVFILIGLSICLFLWLPPKGYIPVLMYHYIYPQAEVGTTSSLNLSIEDFDRQMRFLKIFGYHVISLDQLYEIRSGKRKPNGKEVVVTFDDGHKTYLTNAVPILTKYEIPSANFLIWRYLKGGAGDYMTLEEVKELSKNPLITLGSHTVNHPFLVDVSADEARREITDSKTELERALGKPVNYFCFPGGFLNQELLEDVKEAGYKLAFSTSRKRLSGGKETSYSIVRIKVIPHRTLLEFWLNVSGIIEFGKQIDVRYHQLTGQKANDTLNVYKSANEAM